MAGRETKPTIFACVAALLFCGAAAPTAPAPVAPTPEPSSWPAALVLPWRVLGIDALEVAHARTGLDASLPALAGELLRDVKPASTALAALTDLTALAKAQGRVVTVNAARRLGPMLVGVPKGAAPAPQIALEPVWCSVMDQHVFSVTLVDSESNVLLGGADTSISRQAFEAMGRGPQGKNAQKAWLTETTKALGRRALAAASGRKSQGANGASDALHVGLSLAVNGSRRDEGSSHCLNGLLESRLAGEYTVVRQLGVDSLTTVRDLLSRPSRLKRPTRGLALAWAAGVAEPSRRRLPLTYSLSARPLETVFGKHLPSEPSPLEWEVAVTSAAGATTGSEGRGETPVGLRVPDGLRSWLDAERETLRVADWPRAAHVYGAWVYLDRGRAWGLKMNDRLVASVDGQEIKAHVVRFFGPEAGLSSPRGFKIREGAIVFVREGQKLPKPGVEFKLDQTEFPSPWPPRSGK